MGLENIKKWHCFFEQSGTFKKEFRRLGLEAVDYDILDDYGQTDFKIDLFAQISNAYEGKESIFDGIGENEAIFAFFPCIRFTAMAQLKFTGNSYDMKGKSEEFLLRNSMKLHEELRDLYNRISELALICIERKIPLVIENPYSPDHYLRKFWPIKPKIIDTNRRQFGDYYEKPTQYFFINCDPLNNLIMDEATAWHKLKKINKEHGAERSLISPDYARRFIRTYLKAYDETDADK